jgi:hypothetical protein
LSLVSGRSAGRLARRLMGLDHESYAPSAPHGRVIRTKWFFTLRLAAVHSASGSGDHVRLV